MPDTHLQQFFASLSDEALQERVRNGLSEEALHIATAELHNRGLTVPHADENQPGPAQQEPYLGDWVILERNLTPTDAHLLAACLQAAGIAAQVADATLVQMQMLLTLALGGAKVRVPQSQVPQALEVLQAFRRGELALDDGFDADMPSA